MCFFIFMQGFNNVTGLTLSGDEHIKQSITDILTTPIGSRVMRREYGFDFTLLAAPQNTTTIQKVFISVVKAIRRWESRIVIQKVSASTTINGQLSIDITAKKTDGTLVNTTAVTQ